MNELISEFFYEGIRRVIPGFIVIALYWPQPAQADFSSFTFIALILLIAWAVGIMGCPKTAAYRHNSGIYTWDLLYKLGVEYQSLWANYLDALKAAGHHRKESLKN